MAATLVEFLATRSPAQIAAILTTRPDTAVPPVPRNLADLAERLEIFSSVATAVHLLPAPGLQVIEVLQLLGPDPTERAELAGWLGRPAGDPDLTATLELLAGYALAWPDGPTVRLAAPLHEAFRYPLQLGGPAAGLLARYPAEQLRPIARTLGVPSGGRKPDLIAGIAGPLTDPGQVRSLVAGASAAVRARLHRLATDGPATEHLAAWYGYQPPDPELRWAAERGLVLADSWGVPQLPREAAVALRGPGWHAPFRPEPPEPPLAGVEAGAVERQAAAAGSSLVEQLTALLEAVASGPVALLKAGGVGVKELRRLAKALALAESTVRLWLELAYQAELVAPVRDRSGSAQLLPTAGYDEWAGAEPAERLAVLLPVWRDLPAGPLLAGGSDRKPAPALVRDHDGQLAVAIRHRLLQLAAGLPDGHGVAPGADLAGPVGWRWPLLAGQHPDFDRLVAAVWREAEVVGAVGYGTLTPLGRALAGPAERPGTGGGSPGGQAVAGRPASDRTGPAAARLPEPDHAELAEVCGKLLPPAAGEAVFQADLTALVPGAPARPLATLLDAAADRESRGGAVTWRFTPGSVRRALDAGYQPADLLAALRSRSASGALPQPLEYLVTDLARRHGTVRVREVACVLRADDPALLTELAGARALRSLQLSVIAPTVLSSARPAAETLAALRAAGYAPVGESAGGVPLVERVEPRRAGGVRPRRNRSPAGGPAPADPLALATRLLAAPGPAQRTRPRAGHRPDRLPLPADPAELDWLDREPDLAAGAGGDPDGGELDLAAELADLAGHLAPGERRLLAHAIETEDAITIGYTNAQGDHTTRVIDSVELDGAHLIAWCHLRDDERMFSLRRIDTVAPAPAG